MSRYDTDNYLLHFREDIPAQRDIFHTAEHQGACFKYICNVLNVKPLFKIVYFLCATPDEADRYYGDNDPCNGFAKTPNKYTLCTMTRLNALAFMKTRI